MTQQRMNKEEQINAVASLFLEAGVDNYTFPDLAEVLEALAAAVRATTTNPESIRAGAAAGYAKLGLEITPDLEEEIKAAIEETAEDQKQLRAAAEKIKTLREKLEGIFAAG